MAEVKTKRRKASVAEPETEEVEVEEEEIEEPETEDEDPEGGESEEGGEEIEESDFEDGEEEEEDEDEEDPAGFLGSRSFNGRNSGKADDGKFMGGKNRRFNLSQEGFDLSDEDLEGKTTRIPPGKYPMILSEIDFGESKSSGEDMFTFMFKITEGKHKNMPFWIYAVMNEQNRWKFAGTMKALGRKTKKEMLDFQESDVIGRPVVGVVGDEKDNRESELDVETGEAPVRSKLKRVEPPNEAAIQAAKNTTVS